MLIFLSLYALLTLLNLLDGYTTWHVLKPDKYHREVNPLARWIFRKLGLMNGIIVAETLWISFYTLLLAFLAGFGLLVPLILLLLGIAVFSWVVWDGLRLMRKLKNTPPPINH